MKEDLQNVLNVEVDEKGKAKNMKGGFSLLEIIFAVILVGIVASLTIPNLISGKDKTEISSVLGSDMKNLAEAVTEWKGTDTANSDGTYSAVTNALLEPYLPPSLRLDGGDIVSTGINAGTNKGIKYTILSDTTGGGSTGDSFKIYVDFSDIISAKNLDDRVVQYAEKTAMNSISKISTNVAGTIQEGDATAIGAANATLTVGGDSTDGLCGVRYLQF